VLSLFTAAESHLPELLGGAAPPVTGTLARACPAVRLRAAVPCLRWALTPARGPVPEPAVFGPRCGAPSLPLVPGAHPSRRATPSQSAPRTSSVFPSSTGRVDTFALPPIDISARHVASGSAGDVWAWRSSRPRAPGRMTPAGALWRRYGGDLPPWTIPSLPGRTSLGPSVHVVSSSASAVVLPYCAGHAWICLQACLLRLHFRGIGPPRMLGPHPSGARFPLSGAVTDSPGPSPFTEVPVAIGRRTSLGSLRLGALHGAVSPLPVGEPSRCSPAALPRGAGSVHIRPRGPMNP